MREAHRCAREGITINVFLLPNWGADPRGRPVRTPHGGSQPEGRVFFTGGRDLDRFVLWDYVDRRRTIIG